MEKRDIIVIIVAIFIVFIMAVVVKPIITGQPVVFVPETTQTEIIEVPNYSSPSQQMVNAPSEIILTPEPTTIPETEVPVSDILPERNFSPVLEPMTWQPDPDNPMPAIQMTNYAEIVGKYTGLTDKFRIPTPYWEIHYNVTPMDSASEFSMDIKEVNNEGNTTIRTLVWQNGKTLDPREVRFFEGGKEYYLSINANQLKEYRILIQIPLKYIRDI